MLSHLFSGNLYLLKLNLIILCCCFALKNNAQPIAELNSYKTIYALATNQTGKYIAIRSFKAENRKYILLTDPFTLTNRIEPAENYQLNNVELNNIRVIFKTSPYIKAIENILLNDKPIQNSGLNTPLANRKGITLTVDLCPAHKEMDRSIINNLLSYFNGASLPIPISFSISGKWLLKHPTDFEWLKQLQNKKQFTITWVNHSYNHQVNHLPLTQNFMLAPGTNVQAEIFDNEKLLLKNGIVPSVFFRFPGLVSDQKLIEKVLQYGLIPLGSDAWLAKGGKAKNGSIVLIHGNGNETSGVKDFINLLQSKKNDILNKQWMLFDLSQGVVSSFK